MPTTVGQATGTADSLSTVPPTTAIPSKPDQIVPLGGPSKPDTAANMNNFGPLEEASASSSPSTHPAPQPPGSDISAKPWQGAGVGETLVDHALTADKAAIRLVRAVSEKQVGTVAELLKTSGINVETRDKNGRTLLYIACYNGHAPTVRLLLAHGASVTSYTPSGKSVLSTAVANGNVDVVKLLLQQPNCDPNHQDNAGTVPLMLAAEVTRPAGVSVQLVQMLLGQLPDFQPAIVADVTIRDFSHQTALDRCFRCNADPRVAQALVKAGAKVVEHCEYASGGHHYATTSLMNAAMNGLTKVVEWLLFDIGVDPFAKTAHGLDARAFAEGKGHAEIVAMLEKRMSK